MSSSAVFVLLLSVHVRQPVPVVDSGGQTQGTGGDDDAGLGAADTGDSTITHEYLEGIVAKTIEEGLQTASDLSTAGKWAELQEILVDLHALSPDDQGVLSKLANASLQLGNIEQAADHLESLLIVAPESTSARARLIEILLQLDGHERLERAVWHLEYLKKTRGVTRELLIRQALAAKKRGYLAQVEADLERALTTSRRDSALGWATTPAGTIQSRLGDAYLAQRKLDEAEAAYAEAIRLGDPQAVARQNALAVTRVARRMGWVSIPQTPPPEARARIDLARRDWQRGKRAEALSDLALLVKEYPGAADVRQQWAEYLVADGQLTRAELVYLRGLVIEPGADELLLGLAALYEGHPDRVREAIAAYERVASSNNRETRALRGLASLYQGQGRFLREAEVLKRLVPLMPIGSERTAIETRLGTLEALETKPRDKFSSRVGDELVLAKVRALMAQEKTAAALWVLEKGRRERDSPALARQAGLIMLGAERLSAALAAFDESLAMQDHNDDVPYLRALTLWRLGEHEQAHQAARVIIERFPAAHLILAAAEVEYFERQVWPIRLTSRAPSRARQSLHRYRDANVRVSQRWANRLMRRTSELYRHQRVDRFLVGALLVLMILWLAVRRFGGVGLNGLLRRAPQVHDEVQQILASIRHEVLKHHMVSLGSLASALRNGEDIRPASEAALRAVFTEDAAQAPRQRFSAYMLRLETLAVGAGLRLNWRYKQPQLAAIDRALHDLERLRPVLKKASRGQVPNRRQSRLICNLSEKLSDRGAKEVASLLRRVRTTLLTRRKVVQVYQSVVRELGCSDSAPSLQWKYDIELPHLVQMSQKDLDDVLANLLRNAVESTESPQPVQCWVYDEVHPITGHRASCIGICDHGELFDTQVVWEQGVQRGLGIVRTIVSRYEGTVMVEETAGEFRKAVIVKIPSIE